MEGTVVEGPLVEISVNEKKTAVGGTFNKKLVLISYS